jgi:hypothetical protein
VTVGTGVAQLVGCRSSGHGILVAKLVEIELWRWYSYSHVSGTVEFRC